MKHFETNKLDYSVPLKNQLVNISGTLTYRSGGTTLSSGTVIVNVGSKVVGTLTTSSTGTYQGSLEVGIGDVLIFSYTKSGTTYTGTQTVTAAQMTVNLKLL